MPIICSIRRCTGDSRVLRQDRKTQINGRVTRDHIHFKSSVFENPQCHLCKFWPSLLPTNDLLLPHIQDRRNLFDRPLPICLAFEKIHSFFESEVESIGFLWGSGRGAMYINLISTKKLLLNWRFFPTLYKRTLYGLHLPLVRSFWSVRQLFLHIEKTKVIEMSHRNQLCIYVFPLLTNKIFQNLKKIGDGIFGNCFNKGFSPPMRNLLVLEDCTLKDNSGIRFSVTWCENYLENM